MIGIDVERLRDFVLSRRAKDGGFAFCNPLPSSLPETFYAVFVLDAIGEEVWDRELVEFLMAKIGRDVCSIYYVYRTLTILGIEPPDLSEFLLIRLEEAMGRDSKAEMGGEKGITATYSFENPNVLREVYMICWCLNALGVGIPGEVYEFVRMFRRRGGYGIGRENLKDTFYAVFILKDDVSKFVMEHECESGGFAKHPHSYPPYLEDTFYAVSILNTLGYEYRNGKTVRYIYSLQNPDGGFRRSMYGGISTLEDCYYAVASLKMMGVEIR